MWNAESECNVSLNANAQTIDWFDGFASQARARVQAEVRALTSAVASGDTEAFARFYRAWFDSMYTVARRATGRDEAFCLDVVQDAMLRVIRSLKPMNTTGDLRRWLRVLVASCAYDRLRQESRRRAREKRAVAGRSNPGPSALCADDVDRRLRWLHEELESLDDRSVQLLLMRHRFGWTLQQIGNVLGLKPGTVDGRLRRLQRTLRRRAKEQFDD